MVCRSCLERADLRPGLRRAAGGSPEQALPALYKAPGLPQGTVAGSIPGDRLPDAGVRQAEDEPLPWEKEPGRLSFDGRRAPAGECECILIQPTEVGAHQESRAK
jgi:hypothetical protein